MTDVNDAALAKALAKVNSVVTAIHGKVQTQVVDVSKEDQVEAAVAAVDAWGGVDVMFNNAGIMHPKDGDSEDCPDAIWDLTMDINVKGVWYGSKHAVRSLRKHGKSKGSIINTASMVALVGSATPQVAYTASKGAVLAFTREMAIVHAREGKSLFRRSPTIISYVGPPQYDIDADIFPRLPLQFSLPSSPKVSVQTPELRFPAMYADS